MTILDEMLSRLKGDVARVRLFERERVLTLIDEAIMGNDCSSLAGSHTDVALRRLRDLVASGRPGSSGAAEGNEAAVGAEAPAVGVPDHPGRPDGYWRTTELNVICDIVTLLLDIRSDQRVRPSAQVAAARLERWLFERSGAFRDGERLEPFNQVQIARQGLGRNAQEGFGLREKYRKK